VLKKNCGGFNLIRFHFLIRYIIGIDGLETTRYWDDLLRAFPDDNMSSRIIVTTRKDEIADTCHKNCPVYRMRPTLDTKAPEAELVQILCEGTARKRTTNSQRWNISYTRLGPWHPMTTARACYWTYLVNWAKQMLEKKICHSLSIF